MTSHRERPAAPEGFGGSGKVVAPEPTQLLEPSFEEELSGASEKATSVELPRPPHKSPRNLPPPVPGSDAAQQVDQFAATDPNDLPERSSTVELSPTLLALTGTMLGSFRLIRPL